MLLWISFAVLTAATLAVLLRPLLRPNVVASAETATLALYKEQLADLDRQLAAGQLGTDEHAALRQEVARRILREDGTVPATPNAQASALPDRFWLPLAAGIPAAALGIYLSLGSPTVPGRPFAQTQANLAEAPVADLIAKVEARLAANPQDGQGWNVIAPVYFKLERFADAANAYARANAILGETPQRLAGFAESAVIAADGIVTEPARLAYEKLAKLAPDRVEPRFWLALAKEQDGRRSDAATDYRALLALPSVDPKSRALIEERLAAVSGPVLRGPTSADVSAAQTLNATERQAMIEGMVANLAQRLKANGNDAEGWQRLINAYIVLGDQTKARAALASARTALANNAAAQAALKDLSRRIEGTP